MTVRLAYNPCTHVVRALQVGGTLKPDASRTIPPPDVRLALVNSPAERNGTLDTTPNSAHETPPALLVSFVYLKSFMQHRAQYHFRDWVMDSGAFSAHNSGATIPIELYIETCKELLATDPKLSEVFALDVIGDHRGSQRNCDLMWEAGVPAVPCYHHGSPEQVLLDLAKTYPKIALGGGVGLKADYKLKWAQQCFTRVWPKKIHGFAFGAESHILALPWHSVDATNWEAGPCVYGRWKRYGIMSVRGTHQNLRGEVEDLLTVERKAQVRWKKQMAELDALPDAPALRLAMATARHPEPYPRYVTATRTPGRTPDPTVRLAMAPSKQSPVRPRYVTATSTPGKPGK